MSEREPYLKALRFGWLTRFYDRAVAVLLREEEFKGQLVRQARIEAGHRVLDVGCGTATLALMAQKENGDASIVGIDGALEALALARRKALSAGLPPRFCAALAQDLPFSAGTFDRTVSSLFFHHLTRPAKRAVLTAVRETLATSGELHILDWGQAQDPLMRVMFFLVQLLDGFATTTDSVRGRLLALASESGFAEVEETHRARTILGTLALYKAVLGGSERRNDELS